jgi:hypothetical protein
MQQLFNGLARLLLECSGGALAGRTNQKKNKKNSRECDPLKEFPH